MSPLPLAGRAQGPIWLAFKLIVLSVGFAIAFWPDDLRPVAWRVIVALATSSVGVALLGALAALGACLVGLTLLGHLMLPDEATPPPEHPDDR